MVTNSPLIQAPLNIRILRSNPAQRNKYHPAKNYCRASKNNSSLDALAHISWGNFWTVRSDLGSRSNATGGKMQSVLRHANELPQSSTISLYAVYSPRSRRRGALIVSRPAAGSDEMEPSRKLTRSYVKRTCIRGTGKAARISAL